MGFLTQRLTEIENHNQYVLDAVYDILETIKYNIDEPAGRHCGYGLTDTGWEELKETLSLYMEYSDEIRDDILEEIHSFICSSGDDEYRYDIEYRGYELVYEYVTSKKLIGVKHERQ